MRSYHDRLKFGGFYLGARGIDGGGRAAAWVVLWCECWLGVLFSMGGVGGFEHRRVLVADGCC